MCDLPGAGIEPMSLAPAGRFLTNWTIREVSPSLFLKYNSIEKKMTVYFWLKSADTCVTCMSLFLFSGINFIFKVRVFHSSILYPWVCNLVLKPLFSHNQTGIITPVS